MGEYEKAVVVGMCAQCASCGQSRLCQEEGATAAATTARAHPYLDWLVCGRQHWLQLGARRTHLQRSRIGRCRIADLIYRARGSGSRRSAACKSAMTGRPLLIGYGVSKQTSSGRTKRTAATFPLRTPSTVKASAAFPGQSVQGYTGSAPCASVPAGSTIQPRWFMRQAAWPTER